MSPLRAGAIALTLIIAVPIILGYGLASEETQVDVDKTEEAGSLSDMILNSNTPYYIAYSSVNNNNTLLRTVTAQGATETLMINPDYVQTSSTTYTYTPIYQTTSDTITLNSSTVESYSDTATTYGTSGSGADVILPSFAIGKLVYDFGGYYYYSIAFESIHGGHYAQDVLRNSNLYAVATGYGYLLSGVDENSEPFEIEVTYFYLTVNGDLDLTYVTYNTLPDMPDVWNATVDGFLALDLDGTIVGFNDATGIVGLNGNVTVSHGTTTTTYSNVTSIKYAQKLGDTVFTYYYMSSNISTYADVSYGWTIPSSTGVYYDFWLNGYVNSYIRLMAHLEPSEHLLISEGRNDAHPALYLSSSSAGYVTAEIEDVTFNLGKYTDIMIEIQAGVGTGYGLVTVTGIAAWPSISTLPENTYNSVVGSCTTTFTDDFTQIYISDVGTNSVELRVDSTEIVAGYFPSTKNRVIDIYSLFPEDRRQSIIIDSVGVYGDYLTIGGVARTVTNGQITVWDEVSQSHATVNVLGMTIDYVESEDGTTWTTYVNGNLTSQAQSEPRLIFGGEWSLTLHRTVTTTESAMQTSWVAGEFALDENGFVMAMLLVALAAFVGLGMTGGRSGSKVGILALICGGAVLISLTLI